jgi:hypothetical protein
VRGCVAPAKNPKQSGCNAEGLAKLTSPVEIWSLVGQRYIYVSVFVFVSMFVHVYVFVSMSVSVSMYVSVSACGCELHVRGAWACGLVGVVWGGWECAALCVCVCVCVRFRERACMPACALIGGPVHL